MVAPSFVSQPRKGHFLISALDTKKDGKQEPITKISGAPTWFATIREPGLTFDLHTTFILILKKKHEYCAHNLEKKITER